VLHAITSFASSPLVVVSAMHMANLRLSFLGCFSSTRSLITLNQFDVVVGPLVVAQSLLIDFFFDSPQIQKSRL
jgi:hypothetical protein